jgi:hypothetical protein
MVTHTCSDADPLTTQPLTLRLYRTAANDTGDSLMSSLISSMQKHKRALKIAAASARRGDVVSNGLRKHCTDVTCDANGGWFGVSLMKCTKFVVPTIRQPKHCMSAVHESLLHRMATHAQVERQDRCMLLEHLPPKIYHFMAELTYHITSPAFVACSESDASAVEASTVMPGSACMPSVSTQQPASTYITEVGMSSVREHTGCQYSMQLCM